MRFKPTLSQLFVASLVALIAGLAALFALVFRSSKASIVESSEQMRNGASRAVEERVQASLAAAPRTVEVFQALLDRGYLVADDPAALENAFASLLLSEPDIDEVTLTFAEMLGFDDEGTIRLAPEGRGQLSLSRSATDAAGEFTERRVTRRGESFAAERHLLGQEPGRLVPAPDPTENDTFRSPASQDAQGTLLTSDVHWSHLDDDRPEKVRRVEVSVQKTVKDRRGRFLGVLRVGLLTHLDEATKVQLAPAGTEDPHRVFLCDAEGRLITRVHATDRWQEDGDDLRVHSERLPPEIAHALKQPALHSVNEGAPLASSSFRLGDQEYLTTFRALADTQDWIVGIVVPRSYYLGQLTAIRDRLLLTAVLIMGGIVFCGSLILRSVRKAQAQINRESLKMTALEFAPSIVHSPFRDVSEVLESLEKAKQAARAMGKYVPLDLVRRLYRDGTEPELGGCDRLISIMFTDVRGFTTLSEELPPAQLAHALGRYLDVMAGIIQRETRGTIDKYIGDAIMALWNAPEPVPEHALMACQAALACYEAGRALAADPEWQGLPPFETRFGLHCGEALVGNFGAHDRFNYTAIGDAVNLAARLESLNKQYGTSILASEQIAERAREKFTFRLLDLVAVKGKTQPTRLYELLGRVGEGAIPGYVPVYERALHFYLQRSFARAAELLARQPEDPPSAILLERCRTYAETPPPPDWAGIYTPSSK